MTERRILIDGADFRRLMTWMNVPQTINEKDYLRWKNERLSKKPEPRDKLYLRGADFSGYWKCARRLYFSIHDPLPQKSVFNKSIFGCIVRHDKIEAYLKKFGWKPEFMKERRLNIGRYSVPSHGHIDALSPSNIILDIKHGFPKDGDILQTGFYQKLFRPQTTNIILLYPSQVKYILNLDKTITKYLPRVLACVHPDIDLCPPLHPKFPNCYYRCEYYKRCGRTYKPPKKQEMVVWANWFKAIEETIL